MDIKSAVGVMPHGDPPTRTATLSGPGDKRAVAASQALARAQSQREAAPVVVSTPQTRLSIDFDRDVGVYVSRSLDASTGEVVDQFPAETRLRQMKAFAELQRQAAEPVLDETV